MKRGFIVVLLLVSFVAVAQKKSDPPAMLSAPILTFDQQMALAQAYQSLVYAEKQFQALPGYKDAVAKLQDANSKLEALQLQYCQSKDGHTYRLDHSTGVWACREDKPAK